jgi:glycerophosphoryl diester phosphodiesterase
MRSSGTLSTLVGALLVLCFCAPSLEAAEIIAHRGASHDAPENTLAAMRLAWEQKADAVEMDLWLSKDGRIVVLHDRDTKRVGGSGIPVVEQTWAEIERVDVGAWKDPRFKAERIPTLDSILSTIPRGRRAFLEIKCGAEILPELSRVIASSGRKPAELAIISFDFETLRKSKEEFPGIEHHYLQGYKKDAGTGEFPQLAPLILKAKSAGFDGLDLQSDWPIDEPFVAQVKASGLKLFVWTVNDPQAARRLTGAGVHGITTDRPGWLRDQLSGAAAQEGKQGGK